MPIHLNMISHTHTHTHTHTQFITGNDILKVLIETGTVGMSLQSSVSEWGPC